MSFNGGLAKINYDMSSYTKEYCDVLNKNEVDLHRLICRDYRDTTTIANCKPI